MRIVVLGTRIANLCKHSLELALIRSRLNAVAQLTRMRNNIFIARRIGNHGLANQQAARLHNLEHLLESALRVKRQVHHAVDEHHVAAVFLYAGTQQVFRIAVQERHIALGQARIVPRALGSLTRLFQMLLRPLNANHGTRFAHARRQLEHAFAATAANVQNALTHQVVRQRHFAQRRKPVFKLRS